MIMTKKNMKEAKRRAKSRVDDDDDDDVLDTAIIKILFAA